MGGGIENAETPSLCTGALHIHDDVSFNDQYMGMGRVRPNWPKTATVADWGMERKWALPIRMSGVGGKADGSCQGLSGPLIAKTSRLGTLDSA